MFKKIVAGFSTVAITAVMLSQPMVNGENLFVCASAENLIGNAEVKTENQQNVKATNSNEFDVSFKSTEEYDNSFKVLDLLNKERKKAGVNPLEMDEELLESAMLRANESAIYFSHERPNGESCFTANGKIYGENIAAGQTTATAVNTAWVNSKEHRQNMINKSYTSVGIGCVEVNGTKFWVQVFSTNNADKVVKAKDYSNSDTTANIDVINKNYEPILTLSATELNVSDTVNFVFSCENKGPYLNEVPLISSDVKFNVSDTSVASIDENGILTGLKGGEVTVSAYLKDFPTEILTQKITVKDPVKENTPARVVMKDKYSCVTNAVRVNWEKIDDATGYRVYRYKTSAKKWKLVSTIKNANTTTYRDGNLKSGTVYKYKVKAYKKVDGKNYWGESSVTKNTSTKSSKLIMKSSNRGKTAIRLNWEKQTGNGYQVYQLINNKWEKIATVRDVNTTDYRISGLDKKTTYKFKVRAYCTDGKGRVNAGTCGKVTATTR